MTQCPKQRKENWEGSGLGHWNLELGIYLEFDAWDLSFFFTVNRAPYTDFHL